MQPPKVSFHESTIISLQVSTAAMTLELADVLIDGQKLTAVITLEGLCEIKRDGLRVESIKMEAADGEVLTLESGPDRLDLIVEWNDFKTHKQWTRSYAVTCDTVDMQFT